MKIHDSTLSMEATTNHKEVNGIISRRFGVSAGQKTNEHERFRLNLNDDDNSTDVTQAATTAQTKQNLSTETAWDNHPFLENTIGNLLGNRAKITQSSRGRGIFRQDSPFSLTIGQTIFKEEIDQLQFASQGTVTTDDGRVLDFSHDLFFEQHNTTVASWRSSSPLLLDPLTLSFDSGFSTLADTSFSFDLDCDGQLDTIRSLTQGSGFLALDNNGDGLINNGSELFGPLSGSGFSALAEYDLYSNTWIDENDPVFDQLLVWMGAGGENAQLMTLREAGVGALSLSYANSDFELKDKDATVIGEVGRAGIFLMEDGEAKSLQEVDLALQDDTIGTRALPKTEPVATIHQAIQILQVMIARRQRELTLVREGRQQRRALSDSLFDRFHHWPGKQ